MATIFDHYDDEWRAQSIPGGCRWRLGAAVYPAIELWVSDESRTASDGTSIGAGFQYPDDRHLHLRFNLGQTGQLSPEDERAFDRLTERVLDFSLEAMRSAER